MAESPVPLLRAHARHAPWNARGLAAHATALVDAAAMRPTNAAARAEPSARAVRFYVASGLLDRPEGTGTAATYNYRHLLQILVRDDSPASRADAVVALREAVRAALGRADIR